MYSPVFLDNKKAREEMDTKALIQSQYHFEWLPFEKLEHQLYNIRHTQHHTGQLAERLRSRIETGILWVGHHPQTAG